MTTPDVPHRLELTIDLPGPAEQVWAAIATADGNGAWFLPTDLDGREGGAVTFHMGEDESSGTITGWDPPRRLEYAEPDWARLAGHEAEPVTPLVTELVVQARSGGTCRLTVVSSAFGTGADWEGEFFAGMERVWLPYFENLRLYLAHFPGRRATLLEVDKLLPGAVESVWPLLKEAAGAGAAGEPFALRGLAGRLERLTDPPDAAALVAHLDDPLPGMLLMRVEGRGNDEVSAGVQGYLFSEDAPAYVEREEPAWRRWLDALSVPAR